MVPVTNSGIYPPWGTLTQQPWSGWEGRSPCVSRSQVCNAPEQADSDTLRTAIAGLRLFGTAGLADLGQLAGS